MLVLGACNTKKSKASFQFGDINDKIKFFGCSVLTSGAFVPAVNSGA